jgi:hypothetical protein
MGAAATLLQAAGYYYEKNLSVKYFLFKGKVTEKDMVY